MVANKGSTSVVLLAVQKPVCRTEEALGWAVRASIVLEAACETMTISQSITELAVRIDGSGKGNSTGHISSTQKPTQSCIGLSSASTLLAAVCATIPGDTSLKMRFVIAWRMKRRTLTSSRPTALAISA